MTTVKLQKKLKINDAYITLVNNYDYHYQSTMLHENAAGTIHPDQTRIMIKDLIDSHKVKFIQNTVVSIHPEEKKVKLENDELEYDILVIGLGFEANTFGIPGLEEYALSIGNINSARLIREHIEYNFAMYHNEPVQNQARLNIVVGGAGFTGIEFVGELANRVPELCKEFDIDKSQVRMVVLEGAPTVMPGFDETLVDYAINSLESRGVEIITGALIRECKPESVVYEKDGDQFEIPSMNVIWAAGVKANSIVEKSGFQTIRGKVAVRRDMRTPEYDNVFVVGDCALIIDPESGKPYPPTAQMAIQEAEIVAENIKLLVDGKEKLHELTPQIRGTVASLGDQDAIGVIFNGYKLYGWKASVMKKLIDNRYLFKLGGFNLLLKKGKFNIFS